MRFSVKRSELVVFIVFFLLFSGLGVWQLKRAEEKRGIQDRINSRSTQSALKLEGPVDWDLDSHQYRKVVVRGEFILQGQLLIDNIVVDAHPGYHVITPLKIAGTDSHVLINRGWVGQEGKRRQAAEIVTPSGEVVIKGIVRTPSALPFVKSSVEPLSNTDGYDLWLYLDLEKYQKESPLRLIPFAILQSNESGDGLYRQWPAYQARVGMHIGYAIQWFAFAIIVSVIFIWLGGGRAGESVKGG